MRQKTTNRRTDNNWDEYGEDRLLSRNRLLFDYHRPVLKFFLNFFSDIDTSSSVLDIGCGGGLFLEILRDLGFQAICGIDVSEPMIKRASEKGLKVEKKNIYKLEYSGFDIVLIMDILEHLDNPQLALKNAYKVLNINGLLFLSIPICDSIHKRIRRLLYSESKTKQMKDWDETHIKGYSKLEVIKMLEKVGFEVIRSQRLSNRVPKIGRFFGKISKFFQRYTFFGLFGDFLIIIAKKK